MDQCTMEKCSRKSAREQFVKDVALLCKIVEKLECLDYTKDLSGNPMLSAHILRGQMPYTTGPYS